jgi:hypothetical protein
MEKALKEFVKPKLEQMIGECLYLSTILDTNIKQSNIAPERIYMEQLKTYVDKHKNELYRLLASIEQVIKLFEIEKSEL